MSIEQNKMLVRRWIELWNTGDMDAIGDAVTSYYVRHDTNAPDVRGPAAQQQLVGMYLAAFPDLHFSEEHLIGEDDLVFARLTAQGTHHGELMGIPATGTQVNVSSMELFRLADGKIAEQWVTVDTLGLLQQLGAIPGAGLEEP